MSKVQTEVNWVQVGLVSKTEDWLAALEEGLSKQYPEGLVGKELNLVSDSECQPTSARFMRSCNI